MSLPRILNLVLCFSVLSACAQSKFEVTQGASVHATPQASPLIKEGSTDRITNDRTIDVHDVSETSDDYRPENSQPTVQTVEDKHSEKNINNEEKDLTEIPKEESNTHKQVEVVPDTKPQDVPVVKESPKVSQKVERTEKPSNEGVATATITEKGFIKPTIYFFPIINEDSKSCAKGSRMITKSGETLINICKSTFETCSLQGSCAVVQNGRTRSFNIIGKFLGVERYFETTRDKCIFGYGVKSSCLDPFYTIAADLSIYKSGDVVYVPSIRGLNLPDGSKHTGYFAIRDQGRGIIGKGRFDFFSGFYSWKHDQNPFTKAGLGSTKTNVPYQVISGKLAQKFLASRSFPSLPANVIDDRP